MKKRENLDVYFVKVKKQKDGVEYNELNSS